MDKKIVFQKRGWKRTGEIILLPFFRRVLMHAPRPCTGNQKCFVDNLQRFSVQYFVRFFVALSFRHNPSIKYSAILFYAGSTTTGIFC
jgi:hypothetical protein